MIIKGNMGSATSHTLIKEYTFTLENILEFQKAVKHIFNQLDCYILVTKICHFKSSSVIPNETKFIIQRVFTNCFSSSAMIIVKSNSSINMITTFSSKRRCTY